MSKVAEEPEFPPPHKRTTIVGHRETEAHVARLIASGVLSNGWLITGGKGIGKATFAYRITRAVLSQAAPQDSLQAGSPRGDKTQRLIAGLAHPDLFVAQRRWDEKKDRYETEIAVETVRKLISFLNRTASMGGWRVAIVDNADELNRNAANALLKVLEEPPARSVLLLLSSAPGRLLATIRSRCRRIDLRDVAADEIASFLAEEGAARGDEAVRIAEASRGRPGFALSLATGDGANAVKAVDIFLSGAGKNGDASGAGSYLVGKNAETCWSIFKVLLIDAITGTARAAATGGTQNERLAGATAGQLVAARDETLALLTRGDALNLDRMQLIMAMGRVFYAQLRHQAA